MNILAKNIIAKRAIYYIKIISIQSQKLCILHFSVVYRSNNSVEKGVSYSVGFKPNTPCILNILFTMIATLTGHLASIDLPCLYQSLKRW